MKLYANVLSSNSRKVVAAAHLVGVPLEMQTVDFSSDFCESAEYLKINPNGRLPALVDGDFKLWESNAIMQYLASKKPGHSAWSTDPKVQADISRWQCWSMLHFGSACATFTYENALKPMFGAGDPNQALLDEALEEFNQHADVLNQHLAGRSWVVGNTITLADLTLAADLMYAKPGKIPYEKFSNIASWLSRVQAEECWKKSEPKR